ncbi:hypothetical protein [Mycobacterium sp.]|uniref:ATP-dependent DNA ligase n=1 Tax=Mycobacterium sp. TaxID=1785 RepID=UPI0025FEF989|nr:hypothetical protein [Mycobacterium sp.]
MTRQGNPLGAASTRPSTVTARSSVRSPAQFGRLAEVQSTRRGLASINHGFVTLLSRNGANITDTFPEISTALSALPVRGLVLDGEIVALNADGVPSFSRLQRRWPQNRKPTRDLMRAVPVRFFAFDVLRVLDEDLTGEPYQARRSVLVDLIDVKGSTIQVPGSWPGVDPKTVLKVAGEHQLEGVVCKRLQSIYTPGIRSPDWIKTPLRKRANFVIGGWVPGSGVNRNTIGALLVGAYDSRGAFQFCGQVHAGLSARHRRYLMSELGSRASATSPFAGSGADVAADAHWVRPELIADIEYRELRKTLRHPSFRGLRRDVELNAVTLPAAAS